ncbi:unnamed protein product, partial [Iphiclides podalirius]
MRAFGMPVSRRPNIRRQVCTRLNGSLVGLLETSRVRYSTGDVTGTSWQYEAGRVGPPALGASPCLVAEQPGESTRISKAIAGRT